MEGQTRGGQRAGINRILDFAVFRGRVVPSRGMRLQAPQDRPTVEQSAPMTVRMWEGGGDFGETC